MSKRPAARSAATLAQVRALTDPLRYRVFEGLLGEARTAKQMAEALGTPPTRLYHHFRVLEQAGLIRPSGTRRKRGTTEKYFKASADLIRVVASPRSARSSAAISASALLQGVLAATQADLGRESSAAASSGRLRYLRRYRIRATPARLAKILAQLETVAGACETAGGSRRAPEFGITLCVQQLAAPRKAPTTR